MQAVLAYNQRLTDYPDISKGVHLQIVARNHGVSVRSIQLWVRKYETQGVGGLRSNYVPRPKKVPAIPADLATDAVKVAAWWAFRIANVACIDTGIIGVAVSLLERGFPLQDIIATIDSYYAHDCDRQKFAFKPFGRWAKYDFEKWLYRACASADYQRGTLSEAKGRKRDVNCRANRQAVRSLDPVRAATDVQTHGCGMERTPSRNREGAVLEQPANALRQARKLRSIGLRSAADQTVRRAAAGIPALAANDNPQTVAEALGRLDDGFRSMLIRAGQGDRDARQEALATMPLWWPTMPAAVRNNVDARIAAWQADHPHVTDDAALNRKLLMFLPFLRDDRSGVQRLFPAARIPI